ncbi:MAG: hypothetical protein ACLP5H_01450 [Desulfomonilaceae bacterium]
MVWLTHALWKKDGGIPIFDIGFICAFATFVYSVVPLMVFWANDFRFDPLVNGRLSVYDLTPEEMGSFHFRHVLYLATLATSYVMFRRNCRIPTGGAEHLLASQRNSIIGLFFLIQLFVLVLQSATGFTFKFSYGSDTYFENYLALSSLPLVVRQIIGKLFEFLLLTKLALLYILIQKCHLKLQRSLLVLWIIFEVVNCFLTKGSRNELVCFLMGAALMYHRLVRPMTLRFVLSAGLLLFLFFTFMGVYRTHGGFEETNLLISQSQGGILGTGGEFDGLFGTTYDVYQRVVLTGRAVPTSIYFNDFINMLPPQQILPFEKLAATTWYLQLIGAADSGVGFMWGVVTQSIVGLDWAELVLRGFVLGFVLTKMHEWYSRRKEHFLANIVYVYLCVRVYYTFRDTTGAILTFIVQHVLPFCVLVWVLNALLSSTHESHGQSPRRRAMLKGAR